jgi:SAM-dependent methyltransferase
VTYNGRTYEEGKKIGWRDGLVAFWFIFKFRFSSNYADAGKVALDALEQAPKFNQWMYEAIKPFVGEQVVELGCGKGNLSKLLKSHGRLLLTDNRPDYLQELRQKWSEDKKLEIVNLDLCESAQYQRLRTFRPDTVVCLNVLEHIKDDEAVLQNLYTVLAKDARLVFLVPFNPKLSSEFDRQIGHFRRYSKGELEAKMTRAGFVIERQFFFNKVGVLAWWIGNKLSRQRTITPWQVKLYNFLTPLFRVFDRILPMSGLSTIVVARKPAEKALAAAA